MPDPLPTARRLCVAALVVLSPAALRPPDPEGSQERTVRFVYRAQLPELPAEAQKAELWLPLPRETLEQEVGDLEIRGPGTQEILVGPRHGNRMVVFRGLASELSRREAVVSFRLTRRAARGGRPAGSEGEPARYLAPDRLVPIGGPIAERAARAAGQRRDPVAVARALYEDVVNHLDYDKSTAGWGLGDALRACNVERGNCTDFHSLFIGMARARGIPARFTMGVPLPTGSAEGTIPGYHCWAEFYVEGKGWIPIDASEAARHPERKAFLFGNLDADRVEFCRGRDIVLPGRAQLEPLNYFIYPLVLVDGVRFEGVRHTFEFRDLGKEPKS